MWAYVAKRLASAAVVVFVVVTLSFFMVRLMPGNAVTALEASLEAQGGLTPQAIQQEVNEIYGVLPRQPVWQQYLGYLAHVVRGDLGRSVTNPSETVTHIIFGALPWTLLLVGVALLVSFVLGVALGTVMAALRTRRASKAVTVVASVSSAVPNYLVAIVLLYELADTHRIFPISGAYSVDVTPAWSFAFLASVCDHAVLPVVAYVVTSFGGWALAMKGSATSALESEYVRAAQARGLGEWRVARSYVGRNSMLPMATSLALSLGFLIGGSVFIETYFGYPGIGYYLVQAVDSRDYSVMMGCFLLITVSVVIANLLVDLAYPLIDPRITRVASVRAPAERRGGSNRGARAATVAEMR